jgi:hypothetical protein
LKCVEDLPGNQMPASRNDTVHLPQRPVKR